MSEMRELEEEVPITIPALTLGWRMQMAMAHADRSREYMAARCGVAASTISRWLHDGGVRPPRTGDLEIWARECRVPKEWLEDAISHDGEPRFGQVTPPKPWLDLVSYDGESNLEDPIRGHLHGLPSLFSACA